MFHVLKPLIFAALLLHHYEVPLDIGADIWRLSAHHALPPEVTAAILVIENGGGAPYDPLEVGRFRCADNSCEAGLLQLKRVWSPEATERCNEHVRASHHRYTGMGDCLFIGSAQVVQYRVERAPDLVERNSDRVTRRLAGARLEDDESQVDLFEARVNLEAGVIAFSYLRAKWLDNPVAPHWLVLFKCSRANHLATPSGPCLAVVKKTLKYQARIGGLMRRAGLK